VRLAGSCGRSGARILHKFGVLRPAGSRTSQGLFVNHNQPAMQLITHLAKHFRDVHFGGNWTVSNLNDQLAGVNWEQATVKLHSFNTIAALVYHIHYFEKVALRVLEGGPLEGSDKRSFDHPPIGSAADWESFLQEVWATAARFAGAIERLPEERLWADFSDSKYGTYYRNIAGIIEHTHYHLGQIALIRKMVQER